MVALSASAFAQDAPTFRPDPFWPKALPDNWILGQVAGIATDRNDHIWIVQRPGTLLDDEKGAMQSPPATKCCKAAPPIMEFDADGNLLRSWGGPGQGYDWPKREHGMFVDSAGNVWTAGNGEEDHQVLKFTPDGKFLMQIGKPGSNGGSNSHTQLGQPAHMVLDEAAGELYVADGYLNRRIVVFDARTGDYKRHWGAYGTRTPIDEKLPSYSPSAPPSKSFGNPVHCVRLSNDGLVYVCDRVNDRIQVFRKDGSFVKEFRIDEQTLSRCIRADARAVRFGIWSSLTIRSRSSFSWPTAQTDRSACCRARTERSSHSGVAPAVSPANSSGSTTSQSIRGAISTRLRSDPDAESKNFS